MEGQTRGPGLWWSASSPSRPPLQVFQRREDGSVNFFRGWQAYRDGFGKLTGEHWLGERPCHPQRCLLSPEHPGLGPGERALSRCTACPAHSQAQGRRGTAPRSE